MKKNQAAEPTLSLCVCVCPGMKFIDGAVASKKKK